MFPKNNEEIPRAGVTLFFEKRTRFAMAFPFHGSLAFVPSQWDAQSLSQTEQHDADDGEQDADDGRTGELFF